MLPELWSQEHRSPNRSWEKLINQIISTSSDNGKRETLPSSAKPDLKHSNSDDTLGRRSAPYSSHKVCSGAISYYALYQTSQRSTTTRTIWRWTSQENRSVDNSGSAAWPSWDSTKYSSTFNLNDYRTRIAIKSDPDPLCRICRIENETAEDALV